MIAALRGREKELRAAGVVRISLFGSTVRGEQRPDSDVDLLAAFDSSRRLSLLDVVGIERQISGKRGQTHFPKSSRENASVPFSPFPSANALESKRSRLWHSLAGH